MEHSGKRREKCPLLCELLNIPPKYFLTSLLWDAAGCNMPGNPIKELQGSSFCSGWREEQGAKPRSCGKNGRFPRHQRRQQILLQIKVNKVVVVFTWLIFWLYDRLLTEPVAWGGGATSVRVWPAPGWLQTLAQPPCRPAQATHRQIVIRMNYGFHSGGSNRSHRIAFSKRHLLYFKWIAPMWYTPWKQMS